MTIPFVIDNQQHTMADVLNNLLAHHKGHSLDIATAYFNVGGWQLLREGLNALDNFRLLLGDESHNFRNRNAQRYENLERILAANNRQGKVSGERKKLILLTATPINNTVFDLYNQVTLVTGGDRSYFAAAGIGDLYKYFQAARRTRYQRESGIALFNLLEEVVIRRTRPFIKEAYPNATIKGQPIRWPERRLKTIRYDLEATYGGIYDKLVNRIETLRLAPYRLETYKKQGIRRDQFEEGREEALAGIFKSRYLKRFESSIEAFRISIRRALQFLETFESYILEGKVLDSASFQKATRFIAREDEEDDAPKQLDPIQQTIATILRSYINSPSVNRKEVIAAIQQLNNPLPGVYIKTLRKAYETFTTNTRIEELLNTTQSISQAREKPVAVLSETKTPVRREDLKLICFDYLWQ